MASSISAQDNAALVSVDSAMGEYVKVLASNTTTLVPSGIQSINLPVLIAKHAAAAEIALSPDCKSLYVSIDQAAYVVNTARAVHKQPKPIVGYLKYNIGN